MFEICHWSDCSVNAHANISALFLTVCAFGCKSSVLSDKINYQIRKRMCVVFRTNMFRSFQGGSIRGSSVYTTHLTVRHIPGTEAYLCSMGVKIKSLLFWAGNDFICLELCSYTFICLVLCKIMPSCLEMSNFVDFKQIFNIVIKKLIDII